MQDNYGATVLYSDEMKTVLNEYKAKKGFDPDTNYLFLVAQRESGKEGGYNPYGKQAGFIFMGSYFAQLTDPYPFIVTLGHELGHGAFRLKHTFLAELGPMMIPEGTTKNLMDYTDFSIGLNKYQWDLIDRSPALESVLP